MNSNVLYICLSLFCVSNLFAQRNPQPHFRNYNTEDGLPSPEVYVAFEDSEGIMWFGTDNGVASFNGYEFKTYGPKEGLMDAVVFDIHEDSKEQLWFGTLSGQVFILSSERDTILPYRFNEVLKEYERKYDKVFLEGVTEREKIYCDVYGFGLLILDYVGRKDSIVGNRARTNLILDLQDLPNPIFTGCWKKEADDYLKTSIAEETQKLMYLEVVNDKSRRTFKKLKYSSYSGSKKDVQRLDDNTLLFCHGNHFYLVQDSNILIQKDDLFSASEIIYNSNGIWLCHIFQKGISNFKSIEDFKKSDFKVYLEGQSVSNFYEDSNKNYWITTLKNGVFYVDNIESIIFDSRVGLSDDKILNLDFAKKNRLYAGGANMDIFEIDIFNNRLENIIKTGWNIDTYNIFYEEPSDVLFCGFARYVNSKWILPNISSSLMDTIYETSITDLNQIVRYKENKLLGAKDVGILLYDIDSNLIFYLSDFKQEKRATAAFIDSKKQIWVGNLEGIHQFSIEDTTYISPKINHPAFHSRVEDITELPDSTLAFATKGYGVMLWKGDYYLQISDEDGLTSNMLEDLHVDENGTLWAGTLNGLNKITIDSMGNPQVRTFTMHNGLPSNEIYQIKSQNGLVWLATGGGLVKFHEQPENPDSPAPLLQSVEVNNEERAAISTTDFSHSENNFEFEFLTINYRMNGKIPYRYRIHPEDEWEYNQNRTVNYPSLPAGDYSFEVQSQNEDRYWSESTIYAFSVLPPWWATNWFRLLFVGLLGWLVYSFYRYRVGLIEKENQFQQQITNLEKSALQAQMNPHFIFNCLNSIQNFILQNEKKKAVEYLSRFAKLVRHNLNASVNGNISLEEEINLLDNYLALERQRFEDKFDYLIVTSDSLKEKYVEFPPMLIQPYVENAIIHGISDVSRKGKIEIAFSEKDDLLNVFIKDNGKGFSKNGEQLKKHKSVGMTITKKRLTLLEQNSGSPVQINTTLDAANNPNGTEVTIKITLKK